MRCPICSSGEDKVIESRTIDDGEVMRRRRECLACHSRFTSYERIEESHLMVIKKDKRREAYDRKKILGGVTKAFEKRPISTEEIQSLVDEVEKEIYKLGREIPASRIGEIIISKLRDIDQVAYVRFASVYREFRDIDEFLKEIKKVKIPLEGTGEIEEKNLILQIWDNLKRR